MKSRKCNAPLAPAHLKPITTAERHDMIQISAYFRAQLARFRGDPEEHWKAATVQVDELIKKMNRWHPKGYPAN